MEKSKRNIKVHRNIVFAILFLIPFGLGTLAGMLYRANDIRMIKSTYAEGIESNLKLSKAYCDLYERKFKGLEPSKEIEEVCVKFN